MCELSHLVGVRLFVTPCTEALPGSSVHGDLLEWVAISFSRGSSQPRDRTQASHIVGRFFTIWATRAVGYYFYPIRQSLLFSWCVYTTYIEHNCWCVDLDLFLSLCSGEGNGTPLQYSCLENPMDGGAWWAAVHGVTKSQARLSDFPFTFHFHALEKEMATHSSVLAWRIPGTEEPSGLPSMGSHRVGHDWSDLALA